MDLKNTRRKYKNDRNRTLQRHKPAELSFQKQQRQSISQSTLPRCGVRVGWGGGGGVRRRWTQVNEEGENHVGNKQHGKVISDQYTARGGLLACRGAVLLTSAQSVYMSRKSSACHTSHGRRELACDLLVFYVQKIGKPAGMGRTPYFL